MASPLMLYVPIKQTPGAQAAAQMAVQNFAAGVKAGLDDSGIVHYAVLSLIPNPPGAAGIDPKASAGVLLMTAFDLPLVPYLETFWKKGPGIKQALQGLAAISANEEAPIETVQQFVDFIVKYNLANEFSKNFYQAYPDTVMQIRSTEDATV
ncbi:MAG: hypothetical protein EOO11_12260 [Chitinophagaceae bacterium]|nr:MAG: hypothetical protein EOO11_12260 [Chitinophagaceae bacterium]